MQQMVRKEFCKLQPTELHQRTPLFIGSKGMMELEQCLEP
jgi:fructose-1,6-bisphosphatase